MSPWVAAVDREGAGRGYDQGEMTLKLKRTPGLYLVGFMAAGKTTVGRSLADELGWCFVDVDEEIETGQRTSIAEIFRERGENYFRDLETETIRRRVSLIEAGDPCVMALGGGAFVQPRNWELIQNNGVTVWLDCELETVRKRLGDDTTRPLADDRGSALTQLFVDRRPLYARADFRIEVDTAEVCDIVRKILRLPIF
ncbi:MAG: shikimate kinase [Acidobacteriaceae bacterium]|nr:shikimate kinase [Acidobacteriaceae bacterium]